MMAADNFAMDIELEELPKKPPVSRPSSLANTFTDWQVKAGQKKMQHRPKKPTSSPWTNLYQPKYDDYVYNLSKANDTAGEKHIDLCNTFMLRDLPNRCNLYL